MDFELSEDETALADAIRSLCAGRFPLDRLRAAEDGDGLLDTGAWGELAEAGVFSLQVPEAAGGVGLGMAAAAVVFEELGRALVPGPLLAVAPGGRGSSTGRPRGRSWSGPSADRFRRGPGPSSPPWSATSPSLGCPRRRGRRRAQSPSTRPSSTAVAASGRSLDPLTPLWRVDRLPAGRPIGGVEEARNWRRAESVLGGALLVGLAAGTMEMAVAYAKQREQFGKPIGSFQAVKHMCADMLVAAETARAAVHAAAVTIDQPGVGDPDRAAAGAGLLAAEAAIKNGKTSIQVHGGMGFTWEVPAHLYLMRARVLAEAIGPVDDLAELVAELY